MDKLKKRALILLCMTFLFFLSPIPLRATERLFVLENLMVNGNFATDSNDDGRADNFSVLTPTITTWSEYHQTIQFMGEYQQGTGGLFYQAQNIKANHQYYFQITAKSLNEVGNNIVDLNFQFYNRNFLNVTNEYQTFSAISIPIADRTWIGLGITTASTIGLTVEFMNFILIDLTETFGPGYEPSISDFETLYLMQIPEYVETGYFQEYNSFEPEQTKSINLYDYPNLSTDLNGIQYGSSVISNYGDNISLNLNAYVYVGSTDWIIASNHPIMKYNGIEYELNWSLSDYNDRVLQLELTNSEEDILKRILFNRYVNSDEYFELELEWTYAQGIPIAITSLWFEISNVFDLKVNIESLLVSHSMETENDFNLVSSMHFKFYDLNNSILLPSIRGNTGGGGGVIYTSYADDFGYNFTDVSRFVLAMDVASPPLWADYGTETHRLYELGLFSSSDVFIPGFYTESELDDLFPNQVCDWFQIGCQASNLFNNMVRSVYTGLRLGDVIAVIDNIMDSIYIVVAVLPGEIKTVVYVILGAVATGLTFTIIERVL